MSKSFFPLCKWWNFFICYFPRKSPKTIHLFTSRPNHFIFYPPVQHTYIAVRWHEKWTRRERCYSDFAGKKILSSHGMSDNNQNNPCSDINIDKIAIQASSVGYIVWGLFTSAYEIEGLRFTKELTAKVHSISLWINLQQFLTWYQLTYL